MNIKIPVGIIVICMLAALSGYGQTGSGIKKKEQKAVSSVQKQEKAQKNEKQKASSNKKSKSKPGKTAKGAKGKSASEETPVTDQEYEKLLRMKNHLSPESPDGMRVNEKIRKIERRRAGYAKADRPDEFMRILSEMRIPYDKTESEYPMGYKVMEIEKAQTALKAASRPAAKLPWIERGPGNVSGRARGIVVDPDDPQKKTWFIGSVGGGVWKTTDEGNSWRNLTPAFPNLAVSTLVMAESNHKVLYAGTGESFYSIDVINGDGIFKSTDRGETWAPLSSTLSNFMFNNVSRIIVDPKDPNIVIASTVTGRYKATYINKSYILKSTDGGLTWNVVYEESDLASTGRVKKVLQVIETPGNFNIQYAAVEKKGILKSTDAGSTWFWSTKGIDDVTGRYELAIAPTNVNKIYAAGEGTPNSTLYVSTDAGANWVKTAESGSEPNWLSAQGWYDNTIVVHPKNENTVYVGGVYIYQIDLLAGNLRKTTKIEVSPVHVDHHNLVIIPKSNGSFRILNANDGGIGISTDSTVGWTKPTDGLNTTQFYGVDKKPGASAYIGGMQDNGTWRSPENSTALSKWTYQIGGDGYETSWNFDDPDKLIGASQYNGIKRSTDGGTSFVSGQSGLSDVGSSKAPFITKIAKTYSNPELLYTIGASGVWKSTNFGANWVLTAISSSVLGGVSSFMNVKVSKANPNIVWAGSRMDNLGKISVSADAGATFNQAINYSLVPMGGISGISTHPYQDSTAYILFSFAQRPKILRTTDLGQTWNDISGFGTGTKSQNGFPDVAVYDLLVLPNAPNTLWAATEIGLFESLDNGATWHLADNGLPAVCIWFINSIEEEVVVGTHGRGIWSVKIPGLSTQQTYKPFLNNIAQGPDGYLSVNVSLRSLYDSTLVKIDGAFAAKIGKNTTVSDTLFRFPVSTIKEISISVVAYKNNLTYESIAKKVNLIAIASPQKAYVNNFNTATDDFFGTGFSIKSYTGFTDNAIHSAHPYANSSNNSYLLKVPVIVADTNAFLKYDDVALVEPGEAGAAFGTPEFYDYVVVEGSRDGSNWIPLENGYDASFDPAWLSSFTSNTAGNSKLFKSHIVNLLNKFAKGEKILIRFRLYADEGTYGWGWVIDNLKIQEQFVNVAENSGKGIPNSFSLSQNYPNPFNPVTTISYTVPKSSKITLKVFDILGKEVAVLVNGVQNAGTYNVTFDGSKLASGTYVYRLESEGFSESKKLILLK